MKAARLIMPNKLQPLCLLALLEEGKSLPWNAVWDMFCLKNGVPVGEEFITEIQKYEADVTSKRN